MAAHQQYAAQLLNRTIELLLTPGQFDMSEFCGCLPNGKHVYYPTRGVACCIGGNIVIAFEELSEAGRELFAPTNVITIERRARSIWHKAFGEGAAVRLDFLGMNLPSVPVGEFKERLRRVTPEQAVAHLLGQALDCEPDPSAQSTIAAARQRLSA